MALRRLSKTIQDHISKGQTQGHLIQSPVLFYHNTAYPAFLYFGWWGVGMRYMLR